MIKTGDAVILKFNSWNGELARYNGKAYCYPTMERAVKNLQAGEKDAILMKYVPEVCGHWIKHEHADIVDGCLVPNYECSKCRAWERNDSEYCPNCGSHMTESKNKTTEGD